MENNQKIVIGDRILTKKELFEEKENLRKERAKLSFEEKIRRLIELQKLAYSWGNKKNVFVWKILSGKWLNFKRLVKAWNP